MQQYVCYANCLQKRESMTEPTVIADPPIRQLTTEQIVANLRECAAADLCCVVVYVSGLSPRVYTSVARSLGASSRRRQIGASGRDLGIGRW